MNYPTTKISYFSQIASFNSENKVIPSHQFPVEGTNFYKEGENFNALFENTALKKGDKITVIAKIDSTHGKEHTRGRWAGIVFAPVGKGKQVQKAPSSFSAKQSY